MHYSRRRLLRRGLEFHVRTINKRAQTKKSGNLFNDPRIYKYIYIYLQSIYLSIYLSITICFHLSIHPFIEIPLSLFLSIYLSICLGLFRLQFLVLLTEFSSSVRHGNKRKRKETEHCWHLYQIGVQV